MFSLLGRTALITGGTQGVGAAIAISLAKAGANVIVHGLSEDEHARNTVRACSEFGHRVSTLFVDLRQPMESVLDQLAVSALRIEPSLDLLVCNAGVFIDKPFLEMSEEIYDRTMHLNVKIGYFLTQFVAKHWIASHVNGRVLFTGSINGLLAESDHSAYDASKSAVAGMVRSLCVALAPHGIRVNSMAPGLVRTPLTNSVSTDPDALRWMEMHTPNGQVPQASVCGPLAAFLLSDEAEHLHGQTIYIDGGMSAWQQPDLPAVLRGRLAPKPM
jgi:NAD(P)-dependent dehydrogenase (short-subunit alcohol dehydrogenase family)